MKKLFLIYLISFFSNCYAQNLEIFELRKRCSLEADRYIQFHGHEILSPSKDVIHTITNHYNKNNGRCLLRIQYTTIGAKDDKVISVYDVIENRKVSTFISGIHDKFKKYWVFLCTLSDGSKCISEQEFEHDAQKLMSE